ncbi:3-deoxy-manno-octulosonate cytidylyltransferase [bacterium]|nr:3-deoxy-manno-octulosonate cytidylyltransferase [bacterium]
MNSEVWIVIPARFQAQRFPGKPLASLHDRPMVAWVLKACQAVRWRCQVVVATDDQRIAKVVESYGGRVEMTAEHHRSGTERLAEVAQRNPQVEWFINVQGDEPGIESELVERLIALLIERGNPDLVVSAAAPLSSAADYNSPHVVKVVTDLSGRALYFSRASIPFFQGEKISTSSFLQGGLPVRQHLGIYGYSGAFLRGLSLLKPGVLAAAENLEQLHWLENGFAIEMVECSSPWSGIDTPEELERFAAKWPGKSEIRDGY